jgi:hypothetical protein
MGQLSLLKFLTILKELIEEIIYSSIHPIRSVLNLLFLVPNAHRVERDKSLKKGEVESAATGRRGWWPTQRRPAASVSAPEVISNGAAWW